MLLIENGYLIDPQSGKEGQYDLLADEGRLGTHDLCPDFVERVAAAIVVAIARGRAEHGVRDAELAEGVHDALGVLEGDAVNAGKMLLEGILCLCGEG